MPKQNDIFHSILIVSASPQFDQVVKKSLSGFSVIDQRKSAAMARRCILERYYDIIVVNSPLPDETGEGFALDITQKCNASVLLVTPQDSFENARERVTEHGILTLPKPLPRQRFDRALKFLIAARNRIHELEKKNRQLEEKMEEMRLVTKAKFFLIENESMTEDDAHRMIGKMAMDNGISRGAAARRILDDA
ncbi:MAG: ANTAR domain-containing protein [Lachnospiraceae bacterium]|nr:ANTAR domain-containing protein [Lachnospiraceae bacterium]